MNSSLHCATGQILQSARTFQECGLHKINISLAPYSATPRKTYRDSGPDRGVQIIAKEKIAGWRKMVAVNVWMLKPEVNV